MLDFFTDFVSYAGQSKSFFDVIVDVFYDTILPLNGLLICIFVIYRWKKEKFNKELDEGAPNYKNSWFERYVDFSVGTFIPVILLLVFINTVALKFFGTALIG
jgi:NSS family neurotransmitter:Na+ symporter